VAYVHPDRGFRMLKRSIADGKLRALMRGRDRDRYEAADAHNT
jgi:5-methyltetrahydropteroyltriglutamate--homocysteine methyltransferase